MKTLFLAASLALSLSGAQAAPVLQQGLEEDVLWTRLKPSIAEISSGDRVGGIAVLIDSRGWFLAHGSALSGPSATAGTVGLHIYRFSVIARDKETNLALLQAENWLPDRANPIKVSAGLNQKGERILAATVDGPFWAELGRKDRVGNMQPSQRYAPLNELRLESGKARVQGALAFNERGELVGVLGATLAEADSKATGQSRGTGANTGAGGASTGEGQSLKTFGPGELTVAYAFGPKLLERVVEGFRRPDHVVRHPSIGIFFKNSPDKGALIESIVPGGEAEKSGLQPGDVVVEADGVAVTEAVGFATVLFNQNIGDDLLIKIRRNGQIYNVNVKVGVQPLAAIASSSFHRSDFSPRNSLNSGRNARSITDPVAKF